MRAKTLATVFSLHVCSYFIRPRPDLTQRDTQRFGFIDTECGLECPPAVQITENRSGSRGAEPDDGHRLLSSWNHACRRNGTGVLSRRCHWKMIDVRVVNMHFQTLLCYGHQILNVFIFSIQLSWSVKTVFFFSFVFVLCENNDSNKQCSTGFSFWCFLEKVPWKWGFLLLSVLGLRCASFLLPTAGIANCPCLQKL